MKRSDQKGFTLIELSIVLVIIGLIVGGVLVGQDLIRAATVRAQVSQIEKYNTAVNTFRDKYGGLPGDLNAAAAAQFGFVTRGQYAGEGDGNGIIEGIESNNTGANSGVCATGGETATFWVDLSTARLTDGSFTTATETVDAQPTNSNLGAYFPPAKIGNGNYVYVWSGGWGEMTSGVSAQGDGINYFGLQGFNGFNAGNCNPNVSLSISVAQAYAIDKKIDDGFPQQGNVTTIVDDNSQVWAGNSTVGAPFTSATAGSTTTCFDNSSAASGTPGVAGAMQHYSVEISNGANVNCALSFRFQ